MYSKSFSFLVKKWRLGSKKEEQPSYIDMEKNIKHAKMSTVDMMCIEGYFPYLGYFLLSKFSVMNNYFCNQKNILNITITFIPD